MKFSMLQNSATGNKDIGAFYGVNRTNRVNDYQMSDMKNVDCESFPYLATRRERKLFYDENKMAAICHDTDIEDDYKVTGVTEDGNFVYRGNFINCDGELAGNTYMCEYLGDYVLHPNMQAVSSLGFMTDISKKGSVSFYKADIMWNAICIKLTAQRNNVWLTVSNAPSGYHSLNYYTGVVRNCIGNDSIAIGKTLKVGYVYKNYATMYVSSSQQPANDCFFVVQSIDADDDGTYYEIEMTAHTSCGEDFDYEQYLRNNTTLKTVVSNNLYYGTGSVTFQLGFYGSNSSPWFAYPYIEFHQAAQSQGAYFNGRLFACDVFGVDIFYTSGSGVLSEKYNFAPGTSLGGAGSVQCADHGRWTALKAYGGALYAFKKNGMYRIYSSDGLSFYMDKVADVGAISREAVCVVSDVMYFLSETGLYRFTGSYPEELPDNLGRHYTDGVLGGYDNKVYCSLSYGGGRELVVYDAAVRAYGVHDDFNAKNFVTYGGKLYGLDSVDGYVYEMSGERVSTEFEIITRKFFLSFEKKGINGLRLYFDFSGQENEKIEVFVSYDGGDWERCFKPITSGKLKYVPIKFKKCDELKVKIAGTGVFTLKGMTLSLYSGGDIRQNR